MVNKVIPTREERASKRYRARKHVTGYSRKDKTRGRRVNDTAPTVRFRVWNLARKAQRQGKPPMELHEHTPSTWHIYTFTHLRTSRCEKNPISYGDHPCLLIAQACKKKVRRVVLANQPSTINQRPRPSPPARLLPSPSKKTANFAPVKQRVKTECA